MRYVVSKDDSVNYCEFGVTVNWSCEQSWHSVQLRQITMCR